MNYKTNIIFGLAAAFVLILLFTPLAFAQTQISYGQTISGSISEQGEQDEFIFSAAAGDTIILSFTKTGGEFTPYVELLDPQGTMLAYSSSGIINATLAATGNFKIILRDYNNIDSGNNQMNFYFTANAGDTIYIPLPELSQVPAGFTPYLELCDSSGTRIAYSSNGSLTVTVPHGQGGYSLSLTNGSSSGIGSYEFTLQCSNNPENVEDLDYNSIIEDSLEAVTGINAYRFTAKANDKITICSAIAAKAFGMLSCYLELYDSSGTLLACGLESLKYTFTSGGTFYLFVSDDNRDGTGRYKIILLNGDVTCPRMSDLISPQVTLTKPQPGEIIESGSGCKIEWVSSDNIGVTSHEIRLSVNSGATYPLTIASRLAAAIQSYDWSVPLHLSTSRARVKVIARDAEGNQGEDAVKGDITIVKTILPRDSVQINYEYDRLNRLIKTVSKVASPRSYTYDALGNRLTLIAGDNTAPTTPVVSDGGQFTSKEGRLYARWSSSDPESGIVEYQYCIGTAKGDTDILNWTSAGTRTVITRSGFRLVRNKTYYFAVKAKNGAGLYSDIGYSDGISIDPGAPTGSIKINNGAQDTSNANVTLYLSATDAISGMGPGSQMRFSNNGYLWSRPEDYAATKSWELIPGKGRRIVYVKFKDAAGNWSRTYFDSIILEPNQPPIARILAYPKTGRASLRVRFYGNQSTDPDGEIASYLWNFGDGATSTATNPTHSFINRSARNTRYYTVTLTVKDNHGATSSTRTTIRVLPRRSFSNWFSGWW